MNDKSPRRPIGPGDPDWLRVRAMHATLRRMIDERGLSAQDIHYQNLRRLIAETLRSRR